MGVPSLLVIPALGALQAHGLVGARFHSGGNNSSPFYFLEELRHTVREREEHAEDTLE